MSDIKKSASASDRHPAVVQGQEDLSGVKSVQIKRNLKKNSEDEYVVNQSVRTEMIYNTMEDAKKAYRSIEDAKEEVEFDTPRETEKEVEKEEITPMTEDEEKSAFDKRKKATFIDSILVEAANSALGIESISETKNPGQIDFGIGGQNQKALESFTGNNGSTTAPEHQNVDGLPYAIKENKTAASNANEHYSLIQPEFPVSDMEHELTLGVNREMEHTKRPDQALEIAIDHLAENPNYYTLLNKVLPESGVEEKTPRNVEVVSNKEDEESTPAEVADKHDYYKSYSEYMTGLMRDDK